MGVNFPAESSQGGSFPDTIYFNGMKINRCLHLSASGKLLFAVAC